MTLRGLLLFSQPHMRGNPKLPVMDGAVRCLHSTEVAKLEELGLELAGEKTRSVALTMMILISLGIPSYTGRSGRKAEHLLAQPRINPGPTSEAESRKRVPKSRHSTRRPWRHWAGELGV